MKRIFLLLALSFQLLAPSSFATYQPTITVGSSTLPTGAATSANQVSGGPQTGSGAVTGTTQRVTLATDGPGVSNLASIATNTAVQFGSGVVTATTQRVTLASDGQAVASLSSIDGKTPALVGGRQPVDGSGVTQPVSGTFWQATQPVSASSPLPVQPATSFALTPAQTTSANGVINYDILSGSVSGWYDAQAYMGRLVSLTWQSSAAAAGGNMAFEQTNDTTLDASGGSWNLQDSTVQTQSSGASLTLAASTTYRRIGVVTSRYIRIRLTSALTAGTVDMRVFFTSMPYTPITMNVASSAGSGLNMQATGSAAQGATASGNPVLVGGVAKTAQPTARTDGQIVAPLLDKVGRGVMRQGQIRDLVDLNAQVTIANTTETTVVSAIASTFNDLQSIDLAGTITFSGSPTEAYLVLRDVAAGTVRWSYSIPVAGGSFNYARNWMGSELKQNTVNTAWTAQIVFVGGTAPAVSAGGIRVIVQSVRNL